MWKKILLMGVILWHANHCVILNDLGNKSSSEGKEGILLAAAGLTPEAIEAGKDQGGGNAGPNGKRITSLDGNFTIDIPEGAMNEEVNFVITKYNSPTNSLPGKYFPVIDLYEVTPSYKFNKPISITLNLNESLIEAYNLVKSKSVAFSISSTSPELDANRFPTWTAHQTRVEGSKLFFTTNTFSIFGGGTPPPGNQAPTIYGAYYYFKNGCTYLPHRLRTEVIDPDGDAINVFLLTGPGNGSVNSIQMIREGSSNWYNANIPYEAMSQTGIKMQILAVDSNGLNNSVPSTNIFTYPADSGNSVFITNFDRDADNDGILCAWERDNSKSDSNPNDNVGLADTDGDGIPNVSDHTPNGEANPFIDSLTIYPSLASMDVSERISFGVSASFNGSFRFVNASYNTTGNSLNGSPVGSILSGVFTGNHPGLAGVFANVGSMSASATVKVNDTVGPNNITDLSAVAISNTQIRLQWTAPGDNGSFGRASIYQIYRSTSLISNNSNCNGSMVFHGLTPKQSGLQERLDINGLSPNTTYYFCIRAFDDSGNLNSWNGTVSATTHTVPDLVPPANISGATASTISHDRIQLNWTAVGDDSNTGAATAYEIRRSTSPINNDTQCDNAVNVINNVPSMPAGSNLTFTVSGLSDYTVHYFCIRGYDEVNNRGVWNGILTATTLKANQPPFVSLTATTLVDTGETAVLNATSSSDPDAATCLASSSNYVYSWVLANKPIGSNKTSADITNSSTLIAGFIPDVPGDYIFQFSFWDHPGSCAGGSRVTTNSVTVKARAPIYGHGLTPLNLAVNVSTFAGGASAHNDGIGTNARFIHARGITTNGRELFISDGTAIRMINISTRQVTTIAGNPGLINVFQPIDGIGLNATFQFAGGITMDSQYLYVSDVHTIRKIRLGTWEVTTIAGSDYNIFGEGGYLDGVGTNSKLNGSWEMVKIGQYLYIADSGNRRIRRLDTLTNAVITFAGSGASASIDGIGTNASFSYVQYMTYDGSNIYVREFGLIRKISPVTAEVTTVAGLANSDYQNISDGIGADARLGIPGGITSDGSFLYFLDNGYLRKFNIATRQVTTIAGGNSITSVVDGIGMNARLLFGQGMTNDGKSLFLLNFTSSPDHSLVRKVD